MTQLVSEEILDQNNSMPISGELDALRKGQRCWGALSAAERLKPLQKLSDIISEKSDDIAVTISSENGKSKLEALSQEIIPTLDTVYFLLKQAEVILAPEKQRLITRQFYFRGKSNYTVYSPYGTVGILGTWNYAFYLNMSQILFALTAGNAVYLKHSELSPQVGRMITRLMREAGFSDDVFRSGAGGPERGKELVAAGFDKYILTGSKNTGKHIQKELSSRTVPSVMELSGCDAFCVLSDADFDFAARSLLWASFQYSGQTCVAPRRVLIKKTDASRFISSFRKAWDECGDFLKHQGQLRNSLFAESEAAKLSSLAENRNQILVGEYWESGQNGITPVLIGGVANEKLRSMDFMCPAIFLIECDDDDQIIRFADDSDSALGLSIWTMDEKKAMNMASLVHAGQVWINDAFFSVALGCVAFGGYRGSGFGKTRGKEGLIEMTQTKFVSFDPRKKRFSPQLPPYDDNAYKILSGLQRVMFARTFAKKIKALSYFMKQFTKKKNSA